MAFHLLFITENLFQKEKNSISLKKLKENSVLPALKSITDLLIQALATPAKCISYHILQFQKVSTIKKNMKILLI